MVREEQPVRVGVETQRRGAWPADALQDQIDVRAPALRKVEVHEREEDVVVRGGEVRVRRQRREHRVAERLGDAIAAAVVVTPPGEKEEERDRERQRAETSRQPLRRASRSRDPPAGRARGTTGCSSDARRRCRGAIRAARARRGCRRRRARGARRGHDRRSATTAPIPASAAPAQPSSCAMPSQEVAGDRQEVGRALDPRARARTRDAEPRRGNDASSAGSPQSSGGSARARSGR